MKSINQNVLAGTYDPEYAGVINFANSSPVTINPGANVSYEPCNNSTINPGFTALYCSEFRVKADHIHLVYKSHDICIDTNSNKIKDIPAQTEYLIYPNPNNGTFEIKGTEMKSSIKDVQVMNPLGVIIRSEVTLKGNSVFVRIPDFQEGALLVKILNKDDRVFYKKVLVFNQ